MPRIDFHVLPDSMSPEQFACARAADARKAGYAIHIHTGSRDAAATIDDMLWTFRDIVFLPHSLVEAGDPRAEPITIGWHDQAPGGDVLINLAGEVPPFAGDFAIVVEAVPGEPGLKEEARNRFRRYREMGFAPQRHEADAEDGQS